MVYAEHGQDISVRHSSVNNRYIFLLTKCHGNGFQLPLILLNDIANFESLRPAAIINVPRPVAYQFM